MGRALGKYVLSTRHTRRERAGVQVTQGRDLTTNKRVTVKIFDHAALAEAKNLRAMVNFEIKALLRTKDHPNIVQVLDVMTSPSKFLVFIETVAKRDLHSIIADTGRLNDHVAKNLFRQALSAIDHCHARGVCHRNIKPENLLLDRHGNIKLTGFALAGLFDPSLHDGGVANLFHAVCGTKEYVAPEVVQGHGYDGKAADMWSLGVTLYTMLAGFLPFEADSAAAVFDKAQAGYFMFAPDMSDLARSLLECLLQPSPRKRHTAEQVRLHPWIAHDPTEERYLLSSEGLSNSGSVTTDDSPDSASRDYSGCARRPSRSYLRDAKRDGPVPISPGSPAGASLSRTAHKCGRSKRLRRQCSVSAGSTFPWPCRTMVTHGEPCDVAEAGGLVFKYGKREAFGGRPLSKRGSDSATPSYKDIATHPKRALRSSCDGTQIGDHTIGLLYRNAVHQGDSSTSQPLQGPKHQQPWTHAAPIAARGAFPCPARMSPVLRAYEGAEISGQRGEEERFCAACSKHFKGVSPGGTNM